VQRFARLAAWPVVTGLSLAGFVWTFAHGQAVPSLFFVPAVAWFPIVLLERFIPRIERADALRDPQARTDIFHAIVGQGFGNQLGAALAAGALALPLGWAGGRFGLALWPTDWPLALQVLVGVFVADGIEYARHRAEHEVSWLWPIHALHHSVDRMNVLKSGRGHALDMVLRHLIVFLPLAVIGAPTEVLLAYVAAVTVLGPIGHSNVDVRLPAFLHRVVMTPQVHRIHHARQTALALSNYANVFPVWDVMFGTFQDPTRIQPDAFGVEDDVMPTTLWGQLAAPFAWRRLTARASLASPSRS
jgi:sterol desaturase/sphingolipid hydroxylase (fatty acid hydroxylase superfamily)